MMLGSRSTIALTGVMARLRTPRVESGAVGMLKSRSSLSRKKPAWTLARQVPPLKTSGTSAATNASRITLQK